MGGECHRLSLQRRGCRPSVRKLSRLQIGRPGHDGYKECRCEVSTTTNVHWWHVIWFLAWPQHEKGVWSIWWIINELSVEGWLGRFIQNMYENARSRIFVSCKLSEEFRVEVGVHQSSCLEPCCSSRFWKTSPNSFVEDVSGKTCIRWPGHNLWISGRTSRKTDSL